MLVITFSNSIFFRSKVATVAFLFVSRYFRISLVELEKKYDKCAFNITLERKKIINFQTNCKEKLNKDKFSISIIDVSINK